MFQRKGRFRPTDPPMPNVNIKKLVPRFDSLIILTCTSFKNGAQYMIEPPPPRKILTSYVFKNDNFTNVLSWMIYVKAQNTSISNKKRNNNT